LPFGADFKEADAEILAMFASSRRRRNAALSSGVQRVRDAKSTRGLFP
jgi:hypothetical protein